MFPAVVNMIPQYRIIASLGWVNTYWACIVPGLGNVANIFLVRNFMKGIPKELDEAAEIDGASDFQIFTRIMLPAIRPILIVIFLFSFTGAWNDFLWPTLVFNDINKMPVTAGLQLLSNQMGQYNQMGSLMAATCMAIVPTLPAVPVRAAVLPAVAEHHFRSEGLSRFGYGTRIGSAIGNEQSQSFPFPSLK